MKSKAIKTVSIKIQTGVYGQFRNLNNKVWFALGEYVDNAVQSFENNRDELREASNGKYQFEVRMDFRDDKIKIFDNAAGIDSKNFHRAFEPANIPIDSTGLNEFGMGMKTASIWLADNWSVRTGALGENEERFVEFDLRKVLKEKRETLIVATDDKPKDKHFTEITLSKLSRNAPSSYQMDKLKKHLASIYRKFIRKGDLKLFINDEQLLYNDPEILVAPFYKNPKGKLIEWKKPIKFSFGKFKVDGFIGILNTMSTNESNGLSLFRRGRVIEGSHDEKYRPKTLCGQIGSPRYKRIFGELELRGFNVSFNKGSFQEHEDLEALMSAIQKEISAKKFDLYSQAEKYIKPKTKDDNVKVAKGIVSALKKSSIGNNLAEKVETSLREIDSKENVDRNLRLSRKAKPIDTHEESLQVKGEKYTLTLQLITEKSISDLYLLEIEDDKKKGKKISYKVNLAHKFFTQFEKLKVEEDYQPVITIIKSLVLAEIVASSQGTKNAGNIRMNFNQFLSNL